MKENKIMKMISRRDFIKASAVVGAAGVLTACGGSSSSTAASSVAASSTAAASSEAAASGSANIGVCIYQFADNFMTLYRTDLEEYLKDMGYAVTIVDGKNDQNTQTEQINTFLQQGVDVLVINPVQTTSAQTIVDTISPSGTPIVFINREPDKAVPVSYTHLDVYKRQLLDSPNLAAGIAGVKLVEPVLNTRKIVVYAVRVNGVVIVVNGNVAKMCIRDRKKAGCSADTTSCFFQAQK